ncbi:hypothetical protein QBC38DRAFT_502996 [Podospora fimiseda]|uniref:Uncharacterized protein n=1 Tax=Podospora fimiseda TaxID=252190 RepID=A0AAN7BHZ7_9PEZI|nr:hypothetical protein QBC38DRAFT_502996 [Podospora fimiseda]
MNSSSHSSISRPQFGQKDPNDPQTPLAALFIGRYPSEPTPRTMFYGVLKGEQQVREFLFGDYRTEYNNNKPIASVMMLGIDSSQKDRQKLLVDPFTFDQVWDGAFDLDDRALTAYSNGSRGLHVISDTSTRPVFFLGTHDYAIIWTYDIESYSTKGIVIGSHDNDIVDYMSHSVNEHDNTLVFHPLYPAYYHVTVGFNKIPRFETHIKNAKRSIKAAQNHQSASRLLEEYTIAMKQTRDIIDRLGVIVGIFARLNGPINGRVIMLRIAQRGDVEDDEEESQETKEAEQGLEMATKGLEQSLVKLEPQVLTIVIPYFVQEYKTHLQIEQALKIKIRSLEQFAVAAKAGSITMIIGILVVAYLLLTGVINW